MDTAHGGRDDRRRGRHRARAWLVSRAGPWLTPRRESILTKALLAGGVIAAGLIGPSAT